jgi:Tfp pilus assembly protein PilW
VKIVSGLRLIHRNQHGFSLVELVFALGAGGLIVSAMTMAIFQVFANNAELNAHMTAVQQVENAIHWMRQDALMAQVVEPNGGSGLPLTLTWVNVNNNVNEVTYSLENGELQRSHSIDGAAPTDRIVAQYIESDSEMTSIQFVDSVLTVRITATVTGFRPSSETRVAEVIPRGSL